MSTFNGGPTDAQNIYEERDATYNGGSPGFVNAIRRMVLNIVGACRAFEWADLVIVNRNNAASDGEHVGRYTQINNNAAGGKLWGTVVELRNNDTSGTSIIVGTEVDYIGHIVVGEDHVIEPGAQVDTLFRTSGTGHVTAGFDIKADIGVSQRGTDPMWFCYNPDRQAGVALINNTIVVSIGGQTTVLGSIS